MSFIYFNPYIFITSPPTPYVYTPFTGGVLGTGGTFDRIWDIKVDSEDFVYISGLYNTSANIYSSTGTILGTLPSVTGDAAFVCKFSSLGVLQYSLIVDSAGSDVSQVVTIENTPDTGVYMTGYYSGTPNIILRSNTNISTVLGTLPVSTGNSVFTCKFSNSGQLLYSFLVESSGSDQGYASTVDASNNIYLGGNYTGTPNIILRSNSNVSTVVGTLPASSGAAAFTTKFNSSGTLQYSFVVDSTTNNDNGWSVACDDTNNMYFGGSYNGTPNIVIRSNSNVSTVLGTLPATAGSDVAFVTKVSDAGSLQYSLLIDGTGSDVSYKIACDSFSNVYMVGTYAGTPNIIFRSNANVSTTVGTLSAVSGSSDGFACKFNSVGTLQYSYILTGSGSDYIYSASCDSSSNIILAGSYATTASLYKRSNANVSVLVDTFPTVTGSTDAAFVSKFDRDGNYFYSIVSDSPSNDVNYAVYTDSSGNMYFGGQNQNGPLRNASSGTYLNYSIMSQNTANSLPTRLGSYYIKTDPSGCTNIPQSGYYSNAFIINASTSSQVNGLVLDAGSNLYASYTYTGTTPTIINKNSTVQGTLPTSTLSAASLTKFDPTGITLFSRIIDGSGSESGTCVSVDISQSNVYLGGTYATTPIIKDQTGFSLLTLPVSNGASAALFSKFSATTGEHLLSRIVDASVGDSGAGISCDLSGNVYLAGTLSGTVRTVKNESNVVLANLFATSNLVSAFIVKFSNTGTFNYGRLVDGLNNDSAFAVTCDSTSNVYLGGVYGSGQSNIFTDTGTVLGTLSNVSTANVFPAGYRFVLRDVTTNNYVGINASGTSIEGTRANAIVFQVKNDSTVYNNSIGGISLQTVSGPNAFSTFLRHAGLTMFARTTDTFSANNLDFAWRFDPTGNPNEYTIFNWYLSPSTTYNVDFNGTNVLISTTTPPRRWVVETVSGSAFACKFSTDGTYLYSLVIDGNLEDSSYGLATDNTANLYITGSYSSSTSANIFMISNANVSTTIGLLPNTTSNAGVSAFLSKFDSIGTYMYSLVINTGTGTQVGDAVSCDLYGNVYMAGYYNGSPSLTYVSNSNVSTNVFTFPTSSGQSAFLLSASSNGSINYLRTVDATTNADQGLAVACDPTTGDVYLGGSYNGTTTIREQFGNNIASLPTSSVARGFITEFLSNSTPVAQNLTSTLSNVYYTTVPFMNSIIESRIVDTDVDSSGNVYFISQRSTTAPVLTSKNAVTMKTMPSLSARGTSLVKITNKGKYEWDVYSTNFGNAGTSTDVMCSLSIENSNVYIGSQQTSSAIVTFYDTSNVAVSAIPASGSADTTNSYIAKFDTNGTFQWKSYVQGTYNFFPSVAASPNSDAVYLAGTKSGSIMNVFNTSNVSVATVPATIVGYAAYLIKYDREGTYQWRTYIDSATVVNRGVISDYKSNVYITGYFGGNTFANIYSSTGSTRSAVITKIGTSNAMYIVKYLADGSFSWYAFMNTGGDTQQFGHGCDPKSNVYISGFTTPNMDIFDKTNYSVARTTVTGPSGVLVKFSEDGYYQWYARVYSPTGVTFDKVGTDIDFDAGSNVYATFTMLTPSAGASSTVTIRDGSGFTTNVSVGVINTSFNMVVKFTESGAFQWACPQTTVVQGRCNSALSVFGSNVYTSGTKLTTATTLYDRNLTAASTIPSTSSNAAYIAQYFTDGTYAFNDFQVTSYQASLIREYPPAALTSASTTLSNQSYGNGTYITSASNVLTGADTFKAFDKTTGALGWSTGTTHYAGGPPATYIFSPPSSTTGFGNGDWLQIQLPIAITLKSYSLSTRNDSDFTQIPVNYYILGSNNGTSWTQIDYRTGLVFVQNETKLLYTDSNTTAYLYYRIHIIAVQTQNSGGYASITEWRLFSG